MNWLTDILQRDITDKAFPKAIRDNIQRFTSSVPLVAVAAKSGIGLVQTTTQYGALITEVECQNNNTGGELTYTFGTGGPSLISDLTTAGANMGDANPPLVRDRGHLIPGHGYASISSRYGTLAHATIDNLESFEGWGLDMIVHNNEQQARRVPKYLDENDVLFVYGLDNKVFRVGFSGIVFLSEDARDFILSRMP